MPPDNVRETVSLNGSLPEQDLRTPVKHAMVDEQTNLRKECDCLHVSYSSASKALSGHREVATVGVQRVFQELLHRWKPDTFAPHKDQDDRLYDQKD